MRFRHRNMHDLKAFDFITVAESGSVLRRPCGCMLLNRAIPSIIDLNELGLKLFDRVGRDSYLKEKERARREQPERTEFRHIMRSAARAARGEASR